MCGERRGGWEVEHGGLVDAAAVEEGFLEGGDFLAEGEVFGLGGAEFGADGVEEAVTLCDVAFEGGYVFCVGLRGDKGDGGG